MIDKIEIRQKKLEYLAGTKFDDEEWAFYNANKIDILYLKKTNSDAWLILNLKAELSRLKGQVEHYDKQ